MHQATLCKSHVAKKDHPCDAYFTRVCTTGGIIAKGEVYVSPVDDAQGPFRQYRICAACFMKANYVHEAYLTV